ncbi:MAG: hypothetical protein LBQ54_15935 [Planctomycetaceae bacterium]|nr:hypothetical protein [Planctomycetaceae bacterium]
MPIMTELRSFSTQTEEKDTCPKGILGRKSGIDGGILPPAANARALDPGRLTLTSFGSPPNRKSFHLEAEGNCDGTARSPVRVAHWSPRAEQREYCRNKRKATGNILY